MKEFGSLRERFLKLRLNPAVKVLESQISSDLEVLNKLIKGIQKIEPEVNREIKDFVDMAPKREGDSELTIEGEHHSNNFEGFTYVGSEPPLSPKIEKGDSELTIGGESQSNNPDENKPSCAETEKKFIEEREALSRLIIGINSPPPP